MPPQVCHPHNTCKLQSLLEHEANIAGFRAELLKSQELQAASFTRDTERLQDGLEKIRSEIR